MKICHQLWCCEVHVKWKDVRLINQYSSNFISTVFSLTAKTVAFTLSSKLRIWSTYQFISFNSIENDFIHIFESIDSSNFQPIHSIDAEKSQFFILHLLYKLRYFNGFVIYRAVTIEPLTQSKRTRWNIFSIHII